MENVHLGLLDRMAERIEEKDSIIDELVSGLETAAKRLDILTNWLDHSHSDNSPADTRVSSIASGRVYADKARRLIKVIKQFARR